MKKQKKFFGWMMVVGAVAILLGIVFVLTDPKEKEVAVDPEMDEFISQMLEYHYIPYLTFEEHTVLGVEEQDEETLVYMMAYMDSYTCDEQGKLELLQTVHEPVVMTLVLMEWEGWAMSDLWMPEPGESTMESVQEKFPEYLWDKLDTKDYEKAHRDKCQREAADWQAKREEVESWNLAMATANEKRVMECSYQVAYVGDLGEHANPLAENAILMSEVGNSCYPCPLYRVDSVEELAYFRKDHNRTWQYSVGYAKFPPYDEIVKEYDEEYFADNALLFVEVGGRACDRWGVESVVCADTEKGKQIRVYIEKTEQMQGLQSTQAYYLMVVEVKKQDLEDVAMISSEHVSGLVE